MNYTEVETLEEYCHFENTSEATRAMLERLIAVASDQVDQYCGRVFGIATDAAPITKTYSSVNGMWNEGATLWLFDDLQSVYSIPTLVGAPTITYIPDHVPYYALYRSDGSWEDPTTIIGYWAYAMTPPESIVQAVLRLASEMVPVPGYTGDVRRPGRIPEDVKALLDPYRRRQMP